jgi:hypothetical protein
LSWLESSDASDLKWSEIPKLKFRLGDSSSLLAIDRKWVLTQIFHGRAFDRIDRVLVVATRAALQSEEFDKLLELSVLRNYLDRIDIESTDQNRLMWKLSLWRGRITRLADLSTYSNFQLGEIAKYLIEERAKGPAVADSVITEVEERADDEPIKRKGEIGGDRGPDTTEIIIKLASYLSLPANKIHSYISRFRSTGWSADLYKLYASELLGRKKTKEVIALLGQKLEPAERRELTNRCMQADLLSRETIFLPSIVRRRKFCGPLAELYLTLNGRSSRDLPGLPDFNLFPEEVPEYDRYDRPSRASLFSENFIIGIVYVLSGNQKLIERWIDGCDSRWSLQIMSVLFGFSIECAKDIQASNRATPIDLFLKLKDIEPLQFLENRDLIELQRTLPTIIKQVLSVVEMINGARGLATELTSDEVTAAESTPYFTAEDIIYFVLADEHRKLDSGAYRKLIAANGERWKDKIVPFAERSEQYAQLAWFAFRHQDFAQADHYALACIDNMLSYGYHKDLYWDEVRQAIMLCHEAGSTKAESWCREIAKFLQYAGEYTDGDETSGLGWDLVSDLLRINPNLVLQYYCDRVCQDEYQDADFAFEKLLQSLKYADPIDLSLASTATDDTTRQWISNEVARQPALEEANDRLDAYFGPVANYGSETTEKSTYSEEPAADFSKIEPSQLFTEYHSIPERWQRNNFLLRWSQQWLNSADRQEAFEAIDTLLNDLEILQARAELLDLLYPIAVMSNKSRAFDLLCRAQLLDYGWSWYLVSPDRARARWKFLKQYFPDKYKEFFFRTVSPELVSGSRTDAGSYFPLVRGVEFFLQFGELALCEQVVNCSIKFGQALLANLNLPSLSWLTTDFDKIDCLLRRLEWLSPVTSERAADALAHLLHMPAQKHAVYKRLITWISEQRLESRACYGLLVFLRAASLGGDLKHIIITELSESVNAPSGISEYILRQLSLVLEPGELRSQPQLPLGLPDARDPGEKFADDVKLLLGPRWLSETKAFAITFFSEWSATTRLIFETHKLQKNLYSFENFVRVISPRDKVMVNARNTAGHVYASAFIRVLDSWLAMKRISAEVYGLHASLALPIDLSWWKIRPNRTPGWWPGSTKEEVPTIQAYEPIVSKTVDSPKEGFSLLAAEGALKELGGPVHRQSISIFGFGYRVHGKQVPLMEILASTVIGKVFTALATERGTDFMNFLANDWQEMEDQKQSSFFMGDLEIIPLVARIKLWSGSDWQWFRRVPEQLALSKPLAAGTNTVAGEDRWNYTINQDVVAYHSDWTDGLTERLEPLGPAACGNFVLAREDWLNKIQKECDFRIAYAYAIRYKEEKNQWDERVQAKQTYGVLNLSSIIV